MSIARRWGGSRTAAASGSFPACTASTVRASIRCAILRARSSSRATTVAITSSLANGWRGAGTTTTRATCRSEAKRGNSQAISLER